MKRQMQRILILGNAGSGKTFLAKELAEFLELELIHLDYHFWQSGWQKPEKAAWLEDISKLLNKSKWVMDGNYSSNLEVRLVRADAVIFLEEKRIKCLWRCFRRYVKYHGRNRPDLQKGCPETFDLEFISWIWNYPEKEKPEILRKLNKSSLKVIVLQGKKEVAEFLKKLEKLKK